MTKPSLLPGVPGPRHPPSGFRDHEKDTEALEAAVREYVSTFRVPSKVQLGHLWNLIPVLSLGERHDERERNSELIAHIVLGYSRPGDWVGIEADRKEQSAVDRYMVGKSGIGGRDSATFRKILEACRERKVRVCFMAGGSETDRFTSDKRMYETLHGLAGDLRGKRLVLLTGRGHGIWRHADGHRPGFVHQIADEVGTQNVTTISLHQTGPREHIAFHNQDQEIFKIGLDGLAAVLVPTRQTNSPFNKMRFAFYQAVVSESTDYLAFT